MRNLILMVIYAILLTSCEDVIDVKLNDAEPRLVIETIINISEEDGSYINSMIKLTTTAPFFDNEVPTVEDAIIRITNENLTGFSFSHAADGLYYSDFTPQPNMDYRLEIFYNDEIYTATTNLIQTAPLEYVEQRDDGGFIGDQIELKVFFTDFPNEQNFYFFTATSERGIRRSVYKDEFFDGNSMFGLYAADDLARGDEVRFSLYGITEEFYNYMFILLQQTGGGGGPFETQPATVRGNIINETNPENYPLGYFRMSEVSIFDYVVE